MGEESKNQAPKKAESKEQVLKSPVVLRGVEYKKGDKAPVLPEDEAALKVLGCI